MFDIALGRVWWIRDDGADDPDDLCLHGDVTVTVGAVRIEEACTVSAAALYLLKSIDEAHLPGQGRNQLLPCCGHFLMPNEACDSVEILGCDHGTDWAVTHDGADVVLSLQGAQPVRVPRDAYARAVFAFADAVQAHYLSALPKRLPEDDYALRGYVAFWNEWARRREGGDG